MMYIIQYASSSSNKEKCCCHMMYIECLVTKILENIFFNALQCTVAIYFYLYYNAICCLFSFLLISGPALPQALSVPSMVNLQRDAYLFGGLNGNAAFASSFNSAIYQLSCSSGICSWSTIIHHPSPHIILGRRWPVTIPVPDYFCREEGEGTTTTISTPTPSGCNTGWIGDGYCDDINNDMNCNYDGGDCCGPNVNTQYCTVIYNYTFSINNHCLPCFVIFAEMHMLGVSIYYQNKHYNYNNYYHNSNSYNNDNHYNNHNNHNSYNRM